jgi:hypothetical protein
MVQTENPTPERVAAWRAVLDADGYVVVPTGLAAAKLVAVVADIWQHTGASPDDAESWYRPDVIRPKTGMVEMYQYQSMWDVRQDLAIHAIFAALHGTDDLWVSIDRVACKPPVRAEHPEYDAPGFIHWDTDINKFPDIPLQLQGVLALEDTTAEMGGFQCVPSIYRDQQRFLDAASALGLVPRAPDIGDHPIERVALRAGEIVVWKTTLLHGNGRNISDHVRLAQYISMNPAPVDPEDREALRNSRVASWENCTHPDADPFPGDPRHIEERRCKPAELTALGRRLLGVTE